jgi:hypothetical protein
MEHVSKGENGRGRRRGRSLADVSKGAGAWLPLGTRTATPRSPTLSISWGWRRRPVVRQGSALSGATPLNSGNMGRSALLMRPS